jgi:predicted MFS family arabinose efflux permease
MKFIFGLYRQAFTGLQRNIWILAFTLFINRSGAMVLLFSSLYFTRELHFSIATAGFIMSFYGLGSILGSYLGGWLTDRKNNHDIMLFSLISSGSILLLILLFHSPAYIAFILFLYAFTGDLFRPANSSSIALYSTPENRTRSVSLVRLAINLGFTVGPAIGGFIAAYIGYHWLFVLDAVTSFAAALLLYNYLPRNRQSEKAGKTSPKQGSLSAYKDYYYLLFIVLVALYGICFFQLFATIPQYFNKECHYSEDTIGLLLALNGLLVVVLEMPLMAFLEKTGGRFRFIVIGVLCLPVAFLLLWFNHGLFLLAVGYTLFMTFSEIFAMPIMMNISLSRPTIDRQGQYTALYAMAYGIANIVAPSLGLGLAAYFGFHHTFIALITISITTAIGFLLLKPHLTQI